MPSYDETNDAVPDTPTSQMTRGQVEAEIVSVSAHIEQLEIARAQKPGSELIHGSSAKAMVVRKLTERRYRIEALKKRIQTLDEWDRAVFEQNVGQGSTSRNRSSQSPSGSRAPNTSTRR
ncbi:hypothetical protein BOTNAR_0049g00020 [Botryotinia narcissicola]|uniref:Uncharacterized protein n=1 Tax=Botryotinia narcissicola TaxID=278944 RepID=A0A4Z1J024_9HELO|nr:hypothetical protein BOTNAR_0049g00020 [Botryotinia narcissicola]